MSQDQQEPEDGTAARQRESSLLSATTSNSSCSSGSLSGSFGGSMGGDGSTRTLHVYYDDVLKQRYRVMDADKTTQLYAIELSKRRRPHMRFYHAVPRPTSVPLGGTTSTTVEPLAEVVFQHHAGSHIDVAMPPGDGGPTLHLRQNSRWKSARTYSSSVTTGQKTAAATMTWRHYGGVVSSPGNVFLEDDQGTVLARFRTSPFAATKAGKLELQGAAAAAAAAALDDGDSEARSWVNEIVVTGLAVVQCLIGSTLDPEAGRSTFPAASSEPQAP